MSESKPKVALHYVKPGVNRSPNILFDRIESSDYLRQNYDFVHLNQVNTAGGKINFKLIKTLAKDIKRLSPDIIHISGIVEGFHCMIAAALAGSKNRIIVTHGFTNINKKNQTLKGLLFKYLIEPITLLFATKIQCNSKFSLNQKVIKLFGRGKSLCIYNIPPRINHNNVDNSFREKYGILPDEVVYVSVGRIVKDKGFETLANAIKKIDKKQKVRFVIIGEGDYKAELEKTLKGEIENKTVIMTGSLSNNQVLNVMTESNVFVLPTMLFETFGLVFVEAALLNLPSIGTNIGALTEVVVNNETGMLITPGSTAELVDAINLYYDNPELRKKMGNQAYIRANKFFSEYKIVRDIEKMYRSMLNVRD